MEYFREACNRIQAGFALHVGKLITQYELLSKGYDADYEATLLICTLHSLLTICKELINAMKQDKRELWLAPVHDVPPWLGISRHFIRRDTFYPSELTYYRFIDHLRNAVCHPTSPEKRPFHPSTGYTTLPDNSGVISRFLFIDSPWVERGRIHSRASSSNELKVREHANRFEEKYTQMGLTIVANSTKYEIWRDKEVYIPIFEAELATVSLRSLVIELANYLAQPTMEDWDGKTIRRLVA